MHVDQQHIDELADGRIRVAVRLAADGDVVQLQGEGRGPVEAFVDGLARATGVQMAVLDFHEHAIGAGSQAKAAAYLELRIADTRTLFGVGIDGNIVTASMKAVVSGLLRSGARLQPATSNASTAH